MSWPISRPLHPGGGRWSQARVQGAVRRRRTCTHPGVEPGVSGGECQVGGECWQGGKQFKLPAEARTRVQPRAAMHIKPTCRAQLRQAPVRTRVLGGGKGCAGHLAPCHLATLLNFTSSFPSSINDRINL